MHALPSGFSSWASGEKWRERVLTFDPSWYLVNMGTGIIVQLLAANFPYDSEWAYIIGYIFFVRAQPIHFASS